MNHIETLKQLKSLIETDCKQSWKRTELLEKLSSIIAEAEKQGPVAWEASGKLTALREIQAFVNQQVRDAEHNLCLIAANPQPKREVDIDLYSLLACNVEAGVFENQVAPILLNNGFGPQAIAEAEKQEPVASMPSNTRYTVEVEGQARTYWDNVHDAITNAQRSVYASVDETTRAICDLKAGRMAGWSYGFSAVRIYPPDTHPQPKREWAGLTDEEVEKMRHLIDWTAHWSYGTFAKAIEAKLKEKNGWSS